MIHEADDGESEVIQQPNEDSVTEELESQIKDLDLEESRNRGIEEELRKRVKELESENANLKDGIQRSADTVRKTNFSVESVKSDPKAFKFYTGLPDYETFKIIFDSFGPALKNLIYHGTQNNPNADSPGYQKRGPKRAFTAEQEFFLVLVRLRLGLLEEDIAFRTGISTSHFS
eukprot:Seg1542.7 transcript_id=Seg1542.7/GoldUCD/mRNA.D3Y31 product="hypothetical protein" protein_id=Seg1542.7/GoldUCD/D3Y31